MDDVIANQLASYRTRLACLDQAAHKAVWENQAPQMFTTKVGEARVLTDDLAEVAGRQSAPTTGYAVDKEREEDELETEAYKRARAVVLYARDQSNEALAAKYDLPRSGWAEMRDEVLIQRARLLETDAAGIVAGADAATAEGYGINAAAVAALKAAADAYEALMVAPQDAIADRSALTASLPVKSRETAAKFDEVEDLLPQFAGTPEGDAFIAAYLASTQIIDRGHGPGAPSSSSSSSYSSSSSFPASSSSSSSFFSSSSSLSSVSPPSSSSFFSSSSSSFSAPASSSSFSSFSSFPSSSSSFMPSSSSFFSSSSSSLQPSSSSFFSSSSSSSSAPP